MSTRPTPAKGAAKKKLRVFGTDVVTGKQVTIEVQGTDPPNESQITGIDVDSGKKVTLTVKGRNRAI
jgi:phosphotransferase system HPr-like phosphotransfer protein